MNNPVAELVVERDREVAAPVKVQEDEGPSTFVYIQNRGLDSVAHCFNCTCYNTIASLVSVLL